MEAKRSIGITIFGILTIVFNLLSLFIILNPAYYIQGYIRPFGMIIYIAGIIFTGLELVLIFNVLKLRSWARKFFVLLNIFYIGWIFITMPVENPRYLEQAVENSRNNYSPEQKRMLEEAKRKAEERISAYPKDQQERARQIQASFEKNMPRIILKVTKVIVSSVFLFWYLLLIFFFTRKKVREQFS